MIVLQFIGLAIIGWLMVFAFLGGILVIIAVLQILIERWLRALIS